MTDLRTGGAMIRLILSSPKPSLRGPIYQARLETDGTLICRSPQPRLDGARALLKCGWPPEALLTMRHETSAHDSFVPAPLGELAKWTIFEKDRGRLRRQRWMPFPGVRGGPKTAPRQKSGVPSPVPGTKPLTA